MGSSATAPTGPRAVHEAVANGLDPWLRAAGFERIQALEEVDCF